MTLAGIPSKAFQVWQRMYIRYLLEPLPAAESEGVTVGKMIVPVTQADELLAAHGIVTGTATYTAGQSVVLNPLTVPTGRRWTLIGFDCEAQFTGDNEVDRFLVRDLSNSGRTVILSEFTGAAREQYWLPTPLKMEEGDSVQCRLDGTGVSAGSVRLQAWVADELLF